MQKVEATEQTFSKEMLEAIQDSFFGGERILIHMLGMEACIVPKEDLEVLEAIEATTPSGKSKE